VLFWVVLQEPRIAVRLEIRPIITVFGRHTAFATINYLATRQEIARLVCIGHGEMKMDGAAKRKKCVCVSRVAFVQSPRTVSHISRANSEYEFVLVRYDRLTFDGRWR
jgi:hypothetical protein